MGLLDSIPKQIEAGLAAVEQRVRVEVETAILRAVVSLFLSRLKVLDPSRQADYSAALSAMGE